MVDSAISRGRVYAHRVLFPTSQVTLPKPHVTLAEASRPAARLFDVLSISSCGFLKFSLLKSQYNILSLSIADAIKYSYKKKTTLTDGPRTMITLFATPVPFTGGQFEIYIDALTVARYCFENHNDYPVSMNRAGQRDRWWALRLNWLFFQFSIWAPDDRSSPVA